MIVKVQQEATAFIPQTNLERMVLDRISCLSEFRRVDNSNTFVLKHPENQVELDLCIDYICTVFKDMKNRFNEKLKYTQIDENCLKSDCIKEFKI